MNPQLFGLKNPLWFLHQFLRSKLKLFTTKRWTIPWSIVTKHQPFAPVPTPTRDKKTKKKKKQITEGGGPCKRYVPLDPNGTQTPKKSHFNKSARPTVACEDQLQLTNRCAIYHWGAQPQHATVERTQNNGRFLKYTNSKGSVPQLSDNKTGENIDIYTFLIATRDVCVSSNKHLARRPP